MGYVHKAFTKDRPDGIESLGKATINIMEQGALYHGASNTDFGQKLESSNPDVDLPHPDEVLLGRNIDCDLLEHYAKNVQVKEQKPRKIIGKQMRVYENVPRKKKA